MRVRRIRSRRARSARFGSPAEATAGGLESVIKAACGTLATARQLLLSRSGSPSPPRDLLPADDAPAAVSHLHRGHCPRLRCTVPSRAGPTSSLAAQPGFHKRHRLTGPPVASSPVCRCGSWEREAARDMQRGETSDWHRAGQQTAKVPVDINGEDRHGNRFSSDSSGRGQRPGYPPCRRRRAFGRSADGAAARAPR